MEIIKLENKIKETIEEDGSSYMPRFNKVLEEAKIALKKRKTLIWIEGPLGCGKSTLTEVLARFLDLAYYLENPEQLHIKRYLEMLYHPNIEIKKLGAVGVNNAYLPHRMQQYSDALTSATSCILDRIVYADDIYMEGFVEDGLMTKEQFEDIKKRRESEINLIKPSGITAPKYIIIQIIGDAKTFYNMKNKRKGRIEEIEDEIGGGVPLDYMIKLTKRYEGLPDILNNSDFIVPIIQIKQELGDHQMFEPANNRHITPILETLINYVNHNGLNVDLSNR